MERDIGILLKWPGKAIKSLYSRIMRFWRENEVIVLVALGATALISGLFGYSEYFSQHSVSDLSPPYSYVESLYRAVLLFKASISVSGPLNPWIELARWIALVLLFYAVLKGVMELFYKQINMQYLKWFVKGQVVIAGYSEESILLARDFIKNDYKVVIADSDTGKPEQQKCRELGIILIDKNPADSDAFQKAQIWKAKYVIGFMKNDGKNVEAAINAYQLKSESNSNDNLSCFVHISDRQLVNLLEQQQTDHDTSSFSFEYFNMYENAAMALLNMYPVHIDRFTTSIKPPHVLIVGSDRLSESLIIHAIRTWLPHYLKTNLPMKITFVSSKASLTIKSLIIRNREIDRLCNFNPVDLDFNKPDMQQLNLSIIIDEKRVKFEEVTSAYICLNNDAASLSAALTLYDRLKVPGKTIVACMWRDSGLGSLLKWDQKKESKMKNLHAFGIIDNACMSDIIVGGWKKRLEKSVIPQAKYEYYVNKKIQSGKLDASKAITWDNLPEEEKDKNRRSAHGLADHLARVGYEITPLDNINHKFLDMPKEDIENMAEWEHQRWYDEAIAAGWKYGPDRNDDKKTNPNLRLWKDLTPDMRKYNLNDAAEAQMFLFETGFQLNRKKKDVSSNSLSPVLTTRID